MNYLFVVVVVVVVVIVFLLFFLFIVFVLLLSPPRNLGLQGSNFQWLMEVT